MQLDGIEQLPQLKRFETKHGNGQYYVRKVSDQEFGMYRVTGSKEEFVGYVTMFECHFKVTHHVAGMTLSKEIAYNEVIIKK